MFLADHSCDDGDPSVSNNSNPSIMNPTSNSQLTERLPLELLEKVLAYSSIPDILRMKQVRRLTL